MAVASFMGLLLVYGLNTWLPQLMASAGYSLNAGLACSWCSTWAPWWAS